MSAGALGLDASEASGGGDVGGEDAMVLEEDGTGKRYLGCPITSEPSMLT